MLRAALPSEIGRLFAFKLLFQPVVPVSIGTGTCSCCLHYTRLALGLCVDFWLCLSSGYFAVNSILFLKTTVYWLGLCFGSSYFAIFGILLIGSYFGIEHL